mgnify:CR=1 FL=1
MEKSEVFKSGHTETAINVSGKILNHEKVKREGPELYHKQNQFRTKAIEEIIRENANLGSGYGDEYSHIPEMIRDNSKNNSDSESTEINKFNAIENFKKQSEAKKFVDRLAVIASETRRINIDLDLS